MAKQPARQGARRRASADLIVNLEEFAQLCGVTGPTMQQHLKDAPVDAKWLLERGRRGRGYKIAAEGGLAWYRERNTQTGDISTERQQRLSQLRLEMLGGDSSEDDVLLTGKQRLEEFQAGKAELAYREAMGELVKVADIEAELINAVIELRRQLQGIGSAIRRQFNLEREVETAIETLIGDRLKAFVAALDIDDESAGGGD